MGRGGGAAGRQALQRQRVRKTLVITLPERKEDLEINADSDSTELGRGLRV